MENLFLTITNFGGFGSVIINYEKGKTLQALFILAAVVFSSSYHLIQCHKHHMPGIGKYIVFYSPNFRGNLFSNPNLEYILLQLDRLGVFAVTTSFLLQPNIVPVIKEFWISTTISLSFMLFSESLHYCSIFWNRYLNDTNKKRLHVLTHGIWHLLAFKNIYRFSIRM